MGASGLPQQGSHQPRRMPSLPTPPPPALTQAIAQAGGWLPFDDFMALALYAPGWGYYSGQRRKFGQMPQSGSDFVTAPELSVQFGRALARQVAQALQATGTREVWEFGAGSGALAHQLLSALEAQGIRLDRYVIVDLSGRLVERQRERLAEFGERVQWVQALPESLEAVVVGNEVLDAMPVKLLQRRAGLWHERGVALDGQILVWRDVPTALRPPLEVAGEHDYLTEIHPQAQAWVRTLAERLKRGAAFLIDYGFPEAEYYHPQRHMGTVMCHHAHQADPDPLSQVGEKDITAHVDFTGIALAGQDAGLQVLGYTSQAHFLINCGLLEGMGDAPLNERVMLQKLIHEHEMGELFKVIAFAADTPSCPYNGWQPIGFANGDRTHTL
jgi:SAM-dependent MidA family methyltransferase